MPPPSSDSGGFLIQPNTMNPNSTARRLPPNVYPLQTFLDIERLMAKLNLTPADCLELLVESLECLDHQITEHASQNDGLPFPPLDP